MKTTVKVNVHRTFGNVTNVTSDAVVNKKTQYLIAIAKEAYISSHPNHSPNMFVEDKYGVMAVETDDDTYMNIGTYIYIYSQLDTM